MIAVFWSTAQRTSVLERASQALVLSLSGRASRIRTKVGPWSDIRSWLTSPAAAATLS
jgi:hypothetical protein